tara:strand:+ start:94 stop:1092 length:999 start_codon:yes stop_codon:yes gene_type:complete
MEFFRQLDKKYEDTFIWPTPQIVKSYQNIKVKLTSGDIEDLFTSKYPNCFPVLFSSARSGITAITKSLDLKRQDYVWIPPYASTCVLAALSHQCTPCPDEKSKNIVASLVFHQWGFPFQVGMGNEIIEDSVDSFCLDESCLFPNDGRFEILSLPKIFGTITGGIILCQQKSDYKKLIAIRDSYNKIKWRQFFLRQFASKSKVLGGYWTHSESINGCLPWLALGDIYDKVTHWDQLAQDRIDKIRYLQSKKIRSELNMNPSRLPTCWPISYSEVADNLLKKHGISHGARHIPTTQKSATSETIKVLPIPLHTQYSIERLQKLGSHLTNAKSFN